MAALAVGMMDPHVSTQEPLVQRYVVVMGALRF